MKTAHFRLDNNLSRLTHRAPRGELEYRFNGPQSLKHLVESLGIPHTEIGSVRANGRVVDSAYLVADGDTIEIEASQPSAPDEAEPRFVLDGHLGRLASHVRMLGLDCLYEPDFDDDRLLRISVDQGRILLTRDRHLLMHKAIRLGYLVRSLEPHEQLPEVVRRYGLRRWIRPFQRCIRCNGLLQAVSKEEILDRLEPLTIQYFEEFRICPACRQIYWKGSHFDRMQRLIEDLQAGAR